MTDLTNRSVEEVNGLLQKHTPILNVAELKSLEDAQLFAIMVEISINYIKEKYDELSTDLKTWCIVVVKNLRNTIKTEDDVKNCIDEFITHYYKNHAKWVEGLGCFATEYDRDIGFVRDYVKTKIGG